MNEEQPYITKTRTVTESKYNPKYGDERVCNCGHSYYRHFDSYENMYPCGCKYCFCHEFVEAVTEDGPDLELARMSDIVGFHFPNELQAFLGSQMFKERITELHGILLAAGIIDK